VDLIPSPIAYWYDDVGEIPRIQGIKPWATSDQVSMAIDILTLSQYQEICYWNLSRLPHFHSSAPVNVNLNSIIACSSGNQLEDSVEIAILPDAKVSLDHCITTQETERVSMADSSTRYYELYFSLQCSDEETHSFTSRNIVGTSIWLHMSSSRPESWLSQANHIFSRLRISANFQDYGASETILGPHSSLTHHSCLGGDLVSARNSSSYSNPSPWFPISLPIRTFSKGAGNIHMARLSSILVP
jgi:hypothetical protein